LRALAQEITALFGRCIDHLREVESRDVIDYYAADLADLAVGVLSCWLVLRDARESPRKRDLARVHFAESVPRLRGLVEVLRAIDPAPIEMRGALLAP
jgi:hypothetical protein